MIRDYAQQTGRPRRNGTDHRAGADLLNQIFIRRRAKAACRSQDIQPIYSPLFAPVVDAFRTLSARRDYCLCVFDCVGNFLAGCLMFCPVALRLPGLQRPER